MKKRIFSFIMMLGLLFLSAQAEKIVFVAMSYAPYCYLDENNKVVGTCASIVDKVAKRVDLDMEIRILPWEECMKKGKDGSVDGIVMLFRRPEREPFFHYPKFSIAMKQYVIFTSPNYQGKKITKVDDLAGLKVGLINGIAYPKDVLEYDKYEKVFANNQEEIMELLAAEKVDAVFSDLASGSFYLDNLENGDKCDLMPLVLSRDRSHLAISKKSPNAEEIYDKVNKELTKMKLSGEIYRIQNGLE